MNIQIDKIVEFAKPIVNDDAFSFAYEEIYEHNEFEIGFDTLIRGIIDSGRPIPQNIYVIFKELGAKFYGEKWIDGEVV